MADKVFKDLKIVEFSWYAAGPMVCKYMADLGAEVIHVESSARPDGFRGYPPFKDNKTGINRSATYAQYNNNKYGVTLNLKDPRGIEIAKEMVARADVVLENFTPGTVNRMGLGYEELTKVNPQLIMLSTCNQGQTGPNAKHPGFGTQLTSLAGFVNLTGWPDRDPNLLYAPYIDFIGTVYGMIALIAALDYRQRTGKGQYLDISQYENGVQFMSPAILDYVVNGRIAERKGNRSDYAVPHAAFPCREDDTWCVIACSDDREWDIFCEVMGRPGWATREDFATMVFRKEHEEELNELIGQWTRQFTAEQVMERLQSWGIEAGVVQSSSQLFTDPNLRDYVWQEVEHPEIGLHNYQRPPFKLSLTPPEITSPGPLLGQHNRLVYQELLGMSEEEYQKLDQEGVFK